MEKIFVNHITDKTNIQNMKKKKNSYNPTFSTVYCVEACLSVFKYISSNPEFRKENCSGTDPEIKDTSLIP